MNITFRTILAAILFVGITSSVMAQKRVEYFWDKDPGIGNGLTLQTFTESEATINSQVDASKLSIGVHTLGVRVINGSDVSSTYYRSFYVSFVEEPVSRIEYDWDKAPAYGQGIPLSFATSDTIVLSQKIAANGLSDGIHTLYLQALTDSHHSATYSRLFYVPVSVEKVSRIEYGWDALPALGKGLPLQFAESDTINISAQLSAKGLGEGIHTLYVRALSSNHQSMVYTRPFYVPALSRQVEAVEYWFDEDPGVGHATHIAASLENDTLKMVFDLNTDGVADGVHLIGLRTLTDGTWSETKVRQFLKRSVDDDFVTRIEYFWDEDPGKCQGMEVSITPGREISIDFEADMNGLDEGTHTLGLRAQSGSLSWSATQFINGIEYEIWDDLQEYLNSLSHDTEDFAESSVYQREFLNTDWQSLFVPFSMSYDNWQENFEVARINGYKEYDDDNDGKTDRAVVLASIIGPDDEALQPNYPYLIRAKNKGGKLEVDASKWVEKEAKTVSFYSGVTHLALTGNYSSLSGLKSAARYRLLGGWLNIPTSDSEVLPPYRWYLTITHEGWDVGDEDDFPSGVRVSIASAEETTGIDTAINEGSGDAIFNLKGQRVDNAALNTNLKKGLYIRNNKKYIVK